MGMVYAVADGVYSSSNGRVRVRLGEVWDAADPVVAAHPAAFSDRPICVRSSASPTGWGHPSSADATEAAVGGPGERRAGTRRPRPQRPPAS